MARHPEAKITTFAVVAPRFTEFPMDMLRYGECYPCTTEAAGAIVASLNGSADEALKKGEKQRVALSTHLDPFGYAFAQAARRWQSFGWQVLVRDADLEEDVLLGADGHTCIYNARHTFKKAG